MTFSARTALTLVILLCIASAAEVTPECVGKLIDYEPAWSPDSRFIAFISNRGGRMNLYLMQLDSLKVTRLTSGNWEDDTPAWSPDGKRIAFVSDRDGNPELYVINADGSGVRRITNHPAADLHPNWSPDGRTLLFTSTRTSRDQNNVELQIFSVALDDSNLRQITRDGLFSYGSWSPTRQEMVVRGERAGNSDIYIADTSPTSPTPTGALRRG